VVEEQRVEPHDREEHHRRAVHREERVIHLRADDVLPRTGELQPDHERLEAAEQEEDERGDAVEDADPLVIDGGQPGHHLRLARYAATARAWSSVSPRAGILTPGLSPPGFFTHSATRSGVFGNMPAASVRRLPNVVRSGPSTPAETPRIVWHATQAPLAKIALPWAASPVGGAGLTRCAAAQRRSEEHTSELQSRSDLVCDTPQNSAHWPQYSPGTCGVNVSWFDRPCTTSRLPPSRGHTQP